MAGQNNDAQPAQRDQGDRRDRRERYEPARTPERESLPTPERASVPTPERATVVVRPGIFITLVIASAFAAGLVIFWLLRSMHI